MPALVPELNVVDFPASLAFYRRLGWQVVYDRPEDDFAYLRLGGADLMIDGLAVGRNFDATLRPADRPFGRGLNLEITVPDIAPLLAALDGIPLPLPVEEKWYRAGDHETGVRQFIVADPDGYLLRFSQPLGTRPPSSDAGETAPAPPDAPRKTASAGDHPADVATDDAPHASPARHSTRTDHNPRPGPHAP